jgi:S1-C subfamily serine protease
LLRSGRSVLLPLVLIALVAGSGLTVIALSVLGAFDPPPARVVIEKVETSAESNLSTSEVVERVKPTLVRIETTRGAVVSSATGVIYRSDGYVLTTADAVAGADSVLVVTADGRSNPARVVGVDPVDDIAVLSIGITDVQSAVIGRPDELAPGEDVLAMSLDASPTELTTSPETVTDSSRRFDATDGSTLHDMIAARGTGTTFDDGILYSDGGVVLGIFTTRTADPTASANGGTELQTTRFATPIDYAVRIADSIIGSGTVRLAWLGVTSDDLDSTTTTRIGRSGTILIEIARGGPADTAGLQVGDIVVTIDDSPITSSSALVVTLRSREVGDSVTVTYIRDGVQRLTTSILGNRP